MKVQDFSENDILSYLMTSEFNEGLTGDEFKFLLLKFRYHYRLMYARNESMKIEVEKNQLDLHSTREIYNKNVNNFEKEKQKFENKYNNLLNRKLTWKERFKGKIIIKDDEINGI